MNKRIITFFAWIGIVFMLPVSITAQCNHQTLNLLDSLTIKLLNKAESQDFLVDPLFEVFSYLQIVCNTKPDIFDLVETHSEEIVDYINDRENTYAGILLEFQNVVPYLTSIEHLIKKKHPFPQKKIELLSSYLSPHDNYKLRLSSPENHHLFVVNARKLIDKLSEADSLPSRCKKELLGQLHLIYDKQDNNDDYLTELYRSINDTILAVKQNINGHRRYQLWHNTQKSPIELTASCENGQHIIDITTDNIPQNYSCLQDSLGLNYHVGFSDEVIVCFIADCINLEKSNNKNPDSLVSFCIEDNNNDKLYVCLRRSCQEAGLCLINDYYDIDKKEYHITCRIYDKTTRRLSNPEKVIMFPSLGQDLIQN